MAWLSVKEVAILIGKTERMVRLYIDDNKLEHRLVKGVGRGGVQYEILEESVYENFPHLKQDVQILSYTGKQREEANHKAMIVEMYWQSGKKPKDFITEYNRDNPSEYITESRLYRWQTKYKRRRCVEDLIDERGSGGRGTTSIPSEVWQYFYNIYMTQQKRSVKLCYDLTVKQFGRDIPSVSAFEREVRKIPQYAIIQYREGPKALNDMLPSMERCRDDILSNDMWCSDHHLTDLFVRSEDGRKAVRLWLTVFQDMKSSKIISYIARNADPNATVVKKCFQFGVEAFGIPKEVYFDNGKDYRAKYFSQDYPISLVNQLGFKISYATPYHGQAKPTERFFGTFESRFSKLFPTYAGCNAKDRPECMQTNEKNIIKCAPSFSEYIEYLEQYITEFNNTPSRGEGLNNQCPDKVYFDNLKVKREILDHDALRLLCGISDTRVVHKNGVTIKGRTFRSEYLYPYLKQPVYVIFDPDNMDKVSVFDSENRAICVAHATVRPMFRHTTEEDYRRAEKEKRAVKALNKKYQPTREFTTEQLLAKQQFKEYQQGEDTQVIEQITPQFTANSKKLKATEKPIKPSREDSLNNLTEYYNQKRNSRGG